MEEKPIFKFKKTSKTIGDFDVNDKTEFTLLIKKEYQDFPKFLHFKKEWNVIETADEFDNESGNITKRGIKASPTYTITTGFVRDGNFIVQQQKATNDSSYTGIHKKYIRHLQSFVDQGYIKDISLYEGDVPKVPKYYANEKTPLEEVQGRNVKIMNLMQAAGSSVPSGSTVQMAPGGVKNPLVKLKLSKPKIQTQNP